MSFMLRQTVVAAAFGAALPLAAFAQAGQTVKIAFMDPLSGPFANIGQNQLKSWQFVAEQLNKKNAAGVKFEFVPFDNKGSPQDSLNTLKAAIDQGIRYVVQGNGSGAAAAIADAVAKYNDRNPGKEVVYINYGAVDPTLTNEKCNFWHFRVDADTSMRMEALTSYMASLPEVKKVYLLNQNYSHGQQVSRYFKDAMKRKRPELQIVGDDMHPIGQVKDFSPYIAKIKASGADAVVTGNWGQDLTQLVKAAKESGLTAAFYTYYAGASGTPTALAGDVGKVRVISYAYTDLPGVYKQLQDDFKKKFADEYNTSTTYNGMALLAEAMAKAKSTEPLKVAQAMEGLTFKSYPGEVQMRKADHQLQMPLYITEWRKGDAQHPYSVENTGYSFQLVKEIPAYVSSTPTSCQMKRP